MNVVGAWGWNKIGYKLIVVEVVWWVWRGGGGEYYIVFLFLFTFENFYNKLKY